MQRCGCVEVRVCGGVEVRRRGGAVVVEVWRCGGVEVRWVGVHRRCGTQALLWCPEALRRVRGAPDLAAPVLAVRRLALIRVRVRAKGRVRVRVRVKG